MIIDSIEPDTEKDDENPNGSTIVEDTEMDEPKSNIKDSAETKDDKTSPSKKAKVTFSADTKNSSNKEPAGETLIGDTVDQEVIENMSMLLDTEIDMLEKSEIITFLTNFVTRNKFTINPTMYMTHDLDRRRQQLKTGARQLRHYFTSIPPTFISHFNTNE